VCVCICVRVYMIRTLLSIIPNRTDGLRLHVCLHVYMFACMHIHAKVTHLCGLPKLPASYESPMHLQTYIHTNIHTHMHTYIHTHMQTHTPMHIHARYDTYTYIHTHTHTYTRIHMNVEGPSLSLRLYVFDTFHCLI